MDHDFTKPVDDLEIVPAQFRPLYKPKDGGGFEIKPDDTTKGAVEAIVGLNTALKAARLEAKAAKGKVVDLSPLAEFGASPTEIAEAIRAKLKEQEEALAKGGAAKLNLDKVKAELAEGHAKELGKREKRIEALTQQLYTHLVEATATSAIAEAKGVPALLMPFVKERVKVVEADGKLGVFVVDQTGDQRYSGTTGQPMTIKELVAEMKADKAFGRLFESESPAGGGTPSAQKTVKGIVTGKDLSPIDKIKAGLAKGQANRV